jgi:hypothetical protein
MISVLLSMPGPPKACRRLLAHPNVANDQPNRGTDATKKN